MGEHRVSIEIKFEMHGVKKDYDGYLNWSDQLPERISMMLVEWYDEAMLEYDRQVFEADTQREQREAAAREAAERAEYERLKAKYESS